MENNDISEAILKVLNKVNKTGVNQLTRYLPPIIDDNLPHALEVLRKHDETSYNTLNKILEKTRTTELKSSMLIQTMDTVEEKKI